MKRLALALPLLLAGVPALAQDADNTTFVVNNAWADPARCNIGNAIRLTFDAARLHQRQLNGQCVAVEGFWRANGLFADAANAAPLDALSALAQQDVRIGLYGKWDAIGPMPRKPRRVTAIGTLADCDQWADTMVMGYCHHAGGPILILSQIRR